MPTDADVPDGRNLSFHLSGMFADYCRNLGRVGKIETLPILQICLRSSQTIGDIYDFEFSLVGKIWDDRETVKSQTVWDFPSLLRSRSGRSHVTLAVPTQLLQTDIHRGLRPCWGIMGNQGKQKQDGGRA